MSANNNTFNEKLHGWIKEAVEDERFRSYEINLAGKTDKGSGYLGEIVFASVSGIISDGQKKRLDLVIKHAKNNKLLRENSGNHKLAFQTEIYMYDAVFPIFHKFQLERNVINMFDSFPKCYKTLMLEDMEVLVLENLRTQGYEVHDRRKALNFNHLKAVLKQYGKLHALSFALRDQHPEEFNILTEGFGKDLLTISFQNKSVLNSFTQAAKKVHGMLKERNQFDLYEKYGKMLDQGLEETYLEVLECKESETVITHGDCWNNNFMFHYKIGDRSAPSKLKIIDFQLAGLKSPVIDLSYFLYAVTSSKELEHFDELLEIYHSSLSNFLGELGSDPELFPLSTLKKHWRQHAAFALVILPSILKLVLCDPEKAPAFEDIKEGQEVGDMLNVEAADESLYFDRLQSMISHYFSLVG